MRKPVIKSNLSRFCELVAVYFFLATGLIRQVCFFGFKITRWRLLTEVSPEVELLGPGAPLEAPHAAVLGAVQPVLLVAEAELVDAARL